MTLSIGCAAWNAPESPRIAKAMKYDVEKPNATDRTQDPDSAYSSVRLRPYRSDRPATNSTAMQALD